MRFRTWQIIIIIILMLGIGLELAIWISRRSQSRFITSGVIEKEIEEDAVPVINLTTQPADTNKNVMETNTAAPTNSATLNKSNIPPAPEQDQPAALPTETYLDIPFTVQAPYANWNLPYQEACEEASVLMAARFVLGRGIEGPAEADAAILELIDFNSNQLGHPIDTTAAETAELIEAFYGLETEVIEDFTWDDVKRALANGYPVIMPAAGRQLGNPHYTSPGPRYHMLVFKGYTPDQIITNDPGTKHGKDYLYEYDTLYSAAHDWNGGNVETGRKVIIIVQPESNEQ